MSSEGRSTESRRPRGGRNRSIPNRDNNTGTASGSGTTAAATAAAAAAPPSAPPNPLLRRNSQRAQGNREFFTDSTNTSYIPSPSPARPSGRPRQALASIGGGKSFQAALKAALGNNNNNNKEYASFASSPSSSHTRRQSLASAPASASTRRSPVQVSELGSPTPNIRKSTTFPRHSAARTPSPTRRAPSAPPLVSPASFLSESSEPPEALPEIYQQILDEELIAEAGATDDDLSGSGKTSPDNRRFKRISASPSGLSNSIRAFSPVRRAGEDLLGLQYEAFDVSAPIAPPQAEEEVEEEIEETEEKRKKSSEIGEQELDVVRVKPTEPEAVQTSPYLEEQIELEPVHSETRLPETTKPEATRPDDRNSGEEDVSAIGTKVAEAGSDIAAEANELETHTSRESDISESSIAEAQPPLLAPEKSETQSSNSSSSFEAIVSTDPEMLARDERRVKELINSDRKAFSKAGRPPTSSLTADDLIKQVHASASGSSSRDSQSRSSSRLSEPSLRVPSAWGTKARNTSKWMERIRNGNVEPETLSAAEAQGSMFSQGPGGASNAVSAWLQNATASPLSEIEELAESPVAAAAGATERRGTPPKLDRQAFSKAREWEAQKKKSEATLSPKSQNALRERSIERLEKSAVATNRLTALGQARSLERLVSPRASKSDLGDDDSASAVVRSGQVQSSGELFKKSIARVSSDPQLAASIMPSISLDVNQHVSKSTPAQFPVGASISKDTGDDNASAQSHPHTARELGAPDSSAGREASEDLSSAQELIGLSTDDTNRHDNADRFSINSSGSNRSTGRPKASLLPLAGNHAMSIDASRAGTRVPNPVDLFGGREVKAETSRQDGDPAKSHRHVDRRDAAGRTVPHSGGLPHRNKDGVRQGADEGSSRPSGGLPQLSRRADWPVSDPVEAALRQYNGSHQKDQPPVTAFSKVGASSAESNETAQGTNLITSRSDSQDLLRRFARASSSSPAPGKVSRSESRRTDPERGNESPLSEERALPETVATPSDIHSSHSETEPAKQPEISRFESAASAPITKTGSSLLRGNGSIPSETPAVKVGGSYLKTPKVVGGWVDTPLATSKKPGIISEDHHDHVEANHSLVQEASTQTKNKDTRDLEALAKTAPKLPRSALSAIIEHAKRKNNGEEGSEGEETVQIDESTTPSLKELEGLLANESLEHEPHATESDRAEAVSATSTTDAVPTDEDSSGKELDPTSLQEEQKDKPITMSSIMNGRSLLNHIFSLRPEEKKSEDKRLQELSTLSVPSKVTQAEKAKAPPIKSTGTVAQTKDKANAKITSPSRKKPDLALDIADSPKRAKKTKSVAVLALDEQCDEAGEFHDFIWPCEKCRRRARSGISLEDEKIGVVQWQTVQIPRLWYWPVVESKPQDRADSKVKTTGFKRWFARPISFPRLTLLGWIVLIIGSFAYAEYKITEAFTPPFYAEVMYDYGVDIDAPRPPFVLTKLIWRNSFGPIFRAVWMAICVVVRAVTGLLGIDAGIFGHGGSAVATPAAQKQWVFTEAWEPDIGLGQDELWF